MPFSFTYRFTLAWCFLWLAASGLYAQKGDTLQHRAEFLANRMEDLARTTDRQQDYSDLTGDYLYYAKHPININSPDAVKLVQMHLLNELQWISLKNYIRQYGPVYSIYELKYITGFNKQTIRRLEFFTTTQKTPQARPFAWKSVFRYGNHQILMRYGQVLEKELGYKTPPDSAFLRPGSVFLGTPQKLYFRYAFRSAGHLRLGITAEKDAGEVFISRHLGDSVRKVLGSIHPTFPDFFSAFAYAAGLGIIKKVIVGDYHLEFGQGVCLWSGLTFGKSAETTETRYYGTGIRPNTSANENRFFRGAAFTLGIKKIALTLFYSHNKVDGSFFISADSLPEISTLQETGNHRTISELLNKNRLVIDAFGGHVAYTGKRWKAGATWYQTRLSLPLSPGPQLYRIYYFRGKQLKNVSVNMAYNLDRLFFFGELAANPGGAFAGVAGINAYPADRLSFTLAYRNFSPRYRVIYASPFMESGRVNNEQGLYFGIKMLLSRLLTLSAYADYFKFPWLKYQVNAPSAGKAFLVQMDITPMPAFSMYFRIRYDQREENLSRPENYTPQITGKSLLDFRYALTYVPNPSLTLKTRLEYVRYKKAGCGENGFLAFQDAIYRFGNMPLDLIFRYALFDTDGWDSRIYAYENDVLYAFTIPPFYDKGQRMYLLLHYKPVARFDIWLKTARTWFFNKQSISSGPETIAGSHKTDIKVQLQFRF